jgi:hypothetical protein
MAIAEMREAYSTNGRDVGLFLDDGVTPTDHVIVSASTIGGVRVLSLEFPRGDGAEYSTFRTYRVVLEAEYTDASSNLLEYHEALSFDGTGGPRRVFLDVLEGLPQEQIGTQATTSRATQSGRAVGLAGYPIPPSPIWPAAELPDRRRLTLRTPERSGGQLLRYTVDWHYSFESIIPLAGTPTIV